MAETKRIAVFYPLAGGLSQEFVRGIFRYARPVKPWEFCLIFDSDATKLVRWKPDAIIGHAFTPEAAQVFQKAKVPVVETGFFFRDLKVPRVGLDHRAVGVLAAEYFSTAASGSSPSSAARAKPSPNVGARDSRAGFAKRGTIASRPQPTCLFQNRFRLRLRWILACVPGFGRCPAPWRFSPATTQ